MNEKLILENQRTIMRALYDQSVETDMDLQDQISKTAEILNPIKEEVIREPTLPEQTHDGLNVEGVKE